MLPFWRKYAGNLALDVVDRGREKQQRRKSPSGNGPRALCSME